jgi:hypothetical protein
MNVQVYIFNGDAFVEMREHYLIRIGSEQEFLEAEDTWWLICIAIARAQGMYLGRESRIPN